MTLYVAHEGKVVQLPYEENVLDEILHAGVVDAETFTFPKSAQAKAALDKAAHGKEHLIREPSVDLENLVPAGELLAVNCGYRNYRSPVYGEETTTYKPAFSLDENLLGQPQIGSSSNVYVPALPVRLRKEKLTFEFPRYLVWRAGGLIEAHYDIALAQFQSGGRTFPPEGARVTPPEILGNYLRNPEIKHIPEGLKKSTGLLGRIFSEKIPRYSFVEQVFLLSSWKGRMMRAVMPGLGGKGYISDWQINEFSFASFEEVMEAARIIRKGLPGRGLISIKKLNHYLLYKALDQSLRTQNRTALVGPIVGDSYTISLPYVLLRTAASDALEQKGKEALERMESSQPLEYSLIPPEPPVFKK